MRIPVMKNRRAVGGLISLIGLVFVFGISSAAYLELNSSQSELINTSVQTNQKVSDRNLESLNFTQITEVPNTRYDITIENMGSDTLIVDSYLVINGKSVLNKENIDVSISAGDTELVSAFSSATNPTSDKVLFVTELGKKCLIPGDVSFREC